MNRCRNSFLFFGGALLCTNLLCANLSLADSAYKDLNAQAIAIALPADIHWQGGNAAQSAVIAGDPQKPGLYVMLMKWKAHHNSHPHFHPNDRFITVLSGTWWVATGSDYDLNKMQPVPVGSVVTHFAKQIHYDGAKDGDVILEIVGMGPATATPAEGK